MSDAIEELEENNEEPVAHFFTSELQGSARVRSSSGHNL
jgi:hypothetical protein